MARKVFTKGDPKPVNSGRKKGVPNKKTAQQKASLELVMTALENGILEDILNVNASRRLQLYTDLMNYIKPKLASNKNEDSVEHHGKITVDFSFGDEDVDGDMKDIITNI